jgi:hypothetical protein
MNCNIKEYLDDIRIRKCEYSYQNLLFVYTDTDNDFKVCEYG